MGQTLAIGDGNSLEPVLTHCRRSISSVCWSIDAPFASLGVPKCLVGTSSSTTPRRSPMCGIGSWRAGRAREDRIPIRAVN